MKLLLASLLAAGAVSATPLTSDTPAGQKLLSQARLLNAPEDGGRELNDNNNYYTSWMTKYSMKWEGCHSIPQFERDEGMRTMLLAKFRMCPTDSCGKVRLVCGTKDEAILNFTNLAIYIPIQLFTLFFFSAPTRESTLWKCVNSSKPTNRPR